MALPLAGELEAADADVVPGFLGLGFGEADRGDLRMAIGAAGDHQLVHRMDVRHAGDLLDADDALMLGLVRQHRRAGDIADGIDARHIGAAIAVDDDAAAVGLDAERFEAEIFDIALHADGGDQPVGGDLSSLAVLGFDSRRDRVRALDHFGHFGVGDDFQAGFFQHLAGKGGNLRVLDRHDRRHQLNDCHIRRPWHCKSWQTRCRWRRSP